MTVSLQGDDFATTMRWLKDKVSLLLRFFLFDNKITNCKLCDYENNGRGIGYDWEKTNIWTGDDCEMTG